MEHQRISLFVMARMEQLDSEYCPYCNILGCLGLNQNLELNNDRMSQGNLYESIDFARVLSSSLNDSRES